jgi:hypothetical protein
MNARMQRYTCLDGLTSGLDWPVRKEAGHLRARIKSGGGRRAAWKQRHRQNKQQLKLAVCPVPGKTDEFRHSRADGREVLHD